VFPRLQDCRASLIAFLRETPGPRRAYLLRDVGFVVERGYRESLLGDPGIKAQLHRPLWMWPLVNRLNVTQLVA
jgi:hypothetical protein